MINLVYVTGNKAKIDSAKQLLEPLGINVIQNKMECIEIQADTIEEVAKFSSKYASDKLKTNVLKNDCGLIVPALNGFPSAYTHYVEDTLTEDGMLKLMQGVENREAYFLECLAYTEYGNETIVFTSITEGTIAHEKSGSYGWGWDRIFIPKGKDKSLANFDDNERYSLWSNEAYIKLAEYLKIILDK